MGKTWTLFFWEGGENIYILSSVLYQKKSITERSSFTHAIEFINYHDDNNNNIN